MTEKNFEPALLFSDCRSEGVGLGLQRGGAIRAVWLRLWGGGGSKQEPWVTEA